ncbi:MAG: Ig-like domain-containing protein, partial [Chlorobium sp.]
LSHTPSAWVDPTGLVSSDVVPFSFQVGSLTVNQIKVAIDSPDIAGSQVYIDRVDINGTALANTAVIYQPVSGDEVRYQLPHGSLYNGGYVLIDPTAYNDALLIQPGTAANPVMVDGGGGVDRVYVLGTPDQYVIRSDSSGVTFLSESGGLNQNAVLKNISAIEFADGSLLTDGHWNTAEGATALLIGNDIVLSFDEEVQKGAGTIAIHTGSALVSTVVESYDVAMSSELAFSGSTLTIIPSIELARGPHYFVTFTDESVKDLAGKSYAGTSTSNFKTVCVVPLLHCLTGTSTFWKTGASLTDVTSTLASNPAVGIASESTTTALDGLYRHLAMPDGTYALTSAKVAGTAENNAVKANDALAALKIAVGMNPNADGSALSPYQYLAADVNHDGQVKAADALNILKMAVNLSTAPEKEWLFVPESVGSEIMSRTSVHWPDNPITVTLGADQELHLIGIVKGDVNGSWVA